MFTERGMIAFATASLAVLFLSLAVPVHANEPPVHRDNSYVNTGVTRQYCWVTPCPPVLYTDFDISKELNPWLDIFVAQVAIGAYDRMKEAEEAEARAAQRLANADKWVWDLSGYTFAALGFLAIALTGIIGFATLKRYGV